MSWFSSVRSTDTALYGVVFIIAFISACVLVLFHDLLALVSCLGTNMRSSFSLIYSQTFAMKSMKKPCTLITVVCSLSISSQIAEAFVLNEDCIFIMRSVCILLSTYLAACLLQKCVFMHVGIFCFATFKSV